MELKEIRCELEKSLSANIMHNSLLVFLACKCYACTFFLLTKKFLNEANGKVPNLVGYSLFIHLHRPFLT